MAWAHQENGNLDGLQDLQEGFKGQATVEEPLRVHGVLEVSQQLQHINAGLPGLAQVLMQLAVCLLLQPNSCHLQLLQQLLPVPQDTAQLDVEVVALHHPQCLLRLGQIHAVLHHHPTP